jgi:hypothetical protein
METKTAGNKPWCMAAALPALKRTLSSSSCLVRSIVHLKMAIRPKHIMYKSAIKRGIANNLTCR